MIDYLKHISYQGNPDKEKHLKEQTALLRLNSLKIVSRLIFFLVLTIVLVQVQDLYLKFSKLWFIAYLVYIIASLLIAIYVYRRSRSILKRNELNFREINFLFYGSIASGCAFNLLLGLVTVKFGYDTLGLIIAPFCLSTILILNNKERLYLIISYYLIATVGLYFAQYSEPRLFFIDNIVTFTCEMFLFYVIGSIIYSNWVRALIQQYVFEKNNSELEKINKSQVNTFNVLRLAFETFEEKGFSQTENIPIEERTQNLLVKFSKTQKLFNETMLKYEDIFENVNDGIVLLDKYGRIVNINPAAIKYLKLNSKDYKEVNLAKLIHPESKAELAKYIKKLVKEGSFTGFEGKIINLANEVKYIEVSSTAVYKNGRYDGSRGIIRDITERKLKDLEIQKARNAEKNFLAKMSHEIRTPLNAIIGMSHLMYEKQPPQEQLEYLNVIKTSSNYLLSLISDILDVAKIEAGEMKLDFKPINLYSVISSLYESFKIQLSDKPVKFIAEFDPKLNGVWFGDELMLNQVLYNLLSNASKFTSTGTIVFSASIIKDKNNKELIQFFVKDTGIGMNKTQLSKIFNKFTQVHTLKDEVRKGTGLGLAICKEIVHLHGGQIFASSNIGVGSCLTFTLPLKRSKESLKKPLIVNSNQYSFKGKKVLIAEDNEMNRLFIQRLFERYSIGFNFALNGKEAIEKASKEKYDLILMDLEMPVLNGLEATMAIRSSNNLNKDTTIIALTASALSSIKEEALNAGMNNFLSKPFVPEQLLEILVQEL